MNKALTDRLFGVSIAFAWRWLPDGHAGRKGWMNHFEVSDETTTLSNVWWFFSASVRVRL